MPDGANGSPTVGGGGFSTWSTGKKVAVVGAGAIAAYLIYSYYRNNVASTAGASTGVATDTSGSGVSSVGAGPGVILGTNNGTTGVIGTGPTNPPGNVDLTSWITSVLAAGKSANVDLPTLQSALYNYTNGLFMSAKEAGALDTIINQVGPAPENLPWNVTADTTQTNTTPTYSGPANPGAAPTTDTSTVSYAAWFPFGYAYALAWNAFIAAGGAGQPVVVPTFPTAPTTTTPTPTPKPPPQLSVMQQFVNAVYAFIHRGPGYKGPVFSTAQQQLAEADVKSGKASLPAGFNAPPGFALNTTTRMLTPIPVVRPPGGAPLPV